jgi:pimeloyl-ACP methyl ester carboxylesterase
VESAWITCRNIALELSLHPASVDAPTVVFAHAMGADAALYSSLVPAADFFAALNEEGLNVVALNFQGHGMSGGRRGHLPFRDALANIREAVAFALERFGEPVGIAGSGLGGFLGWYAALEDDRVGAVASHTIADLRRIDAFEPRWRGRVLATLVGRARRMDAAMPFVRVPLRALYSLRDVFEDEQNYRRWRQRTRGVWSYTLDSLVSLFLTPDDKPAMEAMTKPLLVLTGEADRVVPLAGQEEFVSRLPEAELFVLGGAGHMLPLEHTAQTAARLGEWFRKVL